MNTLAIIAVAFAVAGSSISGVYFVETRYGKEVEVKENTKDIELSGMAMQKVYTRIQKGEANAAMWRKKAQWDSLRRFYGVRCQKADEPVKQLCIDLEQEVLLWLARKVK